MDEKKLIIEPKLTADLHGFGSPTGRLRSQARLYAEGLLDQNRRQLPPGDYLLPVEASTELLRRSLVDSKAIDEAESAYMKHFSSRDAGFTLNWWARMYWQPVLVNKLTKKSYLSYNDLIRRETLLAMARPFEPRLFAYPDFGGGLYR